MKKAVLIGLCCAVVASSAAYAQFAKTDDAVKYRQAGFTLMGNHMGRIGAMLKGDKPFNVDDVRASAAIIDFASKLPWEAFVPGSEQGGNTKAKAEVWKEGDKFKQHAEKLQAATAKLSEAAKSGNQDQVKAAFGNVGQSCKACHDNFRAK